MLIKNKSGEVIIDYNIKIVIAVVALVVILGGLFFIFQDKLGVTISNLLPEYNTEEGDEEIILTGTDSNVNYASGLTNIGDRDLTSQMTYEEKNGLLEKDVDAFYQNIFDNFLILSFSKSGNEILKLKSFAKEEIDPDSKTNAVRILFTSWNDNAVDFVYDAKLNQVFFGNANTGKFIGKENTELISAPSELASLFPEFAKLDNKDWKDIQTIVLSNGLDEFISNIISVVDREKQVKLPLIFTDISLPVGDNQYLYFAGNSFSSVPGIDLSNKKNYIYYTILTKNRPYYKSSWGMKGTFTETKDLTYSCNIKGSWTDCKKENNQFYCRVGYVQSDDYRNDCIFVLFQLDRDDSILYAKGSEKWIAQFSHVPQNYCYSGIVKGVRCSNA